VTLTATPAAGSTFTGWSGGCSGTGSCQVQLDSDAAVTATFSGTNTLSVSLAGNGSGSVSGSGISCPGTCSSSFATGTTVTLAATPAAGSTFTGWSGGGCSGTGSCQVQLNSDTAVTATFSAESTLSVSLDGNGSGGVTGSGISCPGTCSSSFATGTTVSLAAAPAAGSTFTGWAGGGCSGTGSCQILLNSDTAVTASFSAASGPPVSSGGGGGAGFGVAVSVTGPGAGTVTGSGITCPGTCYASLAPGTTVTLAAKPAGGSTFAGWSGVCSGAGSCSLTVSSMMDVTATFNVPPRCTVAVQSSEVTVTGPKASHGSKSGVYSGALSVRARCDQAVASDLTGVLTEHAGQKPKTFDLGPVRDSLAAGVGRTFVLNLPSTALSALVSKTKESVSLKLRATNAQGSTTAMATIASLQVAATPTTPAVPVNTTLPVISGTAQDGQTLRASNGSWPDASPLTYSYQWQRCAPSGGRCSAIAGATSSTFTLAAPDVGQEVTVVVSATDQQSRTGDATATPTSPVAKPPVPVNTHPPVISGWLPVLTGGPQPAQVLRAAGGSWNSPDTLTYRYQWEVCAAGNKGPCVNAGSDSPTYMPTSSDFANPEEGIAVVVTATDQEGQTVQATATQVSLSTSAVKPPYLAEDPKISIPGVDPTISGTAQVGQMLSITSNGSWTPDTSNGNLGLFGPDPVTYRYQWEHCNSGYGNCGPISGATGSTYTLVNADSSHYIGVAVLACDGVYVNVCAEDPSGLIGPVTAASSAGGNVVVCADPLKGCSGVATGGAVAVAVSCAPGAQGCSGTATITSSTPPAMASGARAAEKRAGKSRPTTLGTLHFSLTPGHTKVLHIRLNSAARRLLKADHNRLRATLTIMTGGRKTVRTITIAVASRPKETRHSVS
jgi:hypothetical protein